jgi:hypothetical protein
MKLFHVRLCQHTGGILAYMESFRCFFSKCGSAECVRDLPDSRKKKRKDIVPTQQVLK